MIDPGRHGSGGQNLSSLRASPAEHSPSRSGAHPLPKSVLILSLSQMGLIRPFQLTLPFLLYTNGIGHFLAGLSFQLPAMLYYSTMSLLLSRGVLGFTHKKTPSAATPFLVFSKINIKLLELKLGEWAESILSLIRKGG